MALLPLPPPPPPSRVAREQQLLPDEILEDIFLRLNSGFDLARASSTCRAFHRVATDRRFLRRFLSLHPPPIVGIIEFVRNRGLIQAEPPHRSAPAARAISEAGDFTFSFIPSSSNRNRKWDLRDSRDGRFLLSRYGTVSTDFSDEFLELLFLEGAAPNEFLELVVCDPLYRRYVEIPPIPRDIVPRVPPSAKMDSQPFLAPAEEGGSDFRIIYNWLSDYKVVSFVYSAATGKWRCATSFSFLPARLITDPKNYKRFYAHSCFFWMSHSGKYMLMLDPREMKFSIVELQRNCNGTTMEEAVITEAAENRLGLVILDCRTLVLFSRTFPNNVVGREDWRRESVIPLPKDYSFYTIISAAEGYLLLDGILSSPLSGSLTPLGKPQRACFAVDLKTLLVERLCVLDGFRCFAHLYASFPPPFSLPTLQN